MVINPLYAPHWTPDVDTHAGVEKVAEAAVETKEAVEESTEAVKETEEEVTSDEEGALGVT